MHTRLFRQAAVCWALSWGSSSWVRRLNAPPGIDQRDRRPRRNRNSHSRGQLQKSPEAESTPVRCRAGGPVDAGRHLGGRLGKGNTTCRRPLAVISGPHGTGPEDGRAPLLDAVREQECPQTGWFDREAGEDGSAPPRRGTSSGCAVTSTRQRGMRR